MNESIINEQIDLEYLAIKNLNVSEEFLFRLDWSISGKLIKLAEAKTLSINEIATLSSF